MWTFLFSYLFLRKLGISKPIRCLLTVLMIGLIVAALIYALGLFLTLEERTNPTHVYARNFFDASAIAAR
jgi:uncharacterized membrane protein